MANTDKNIVITPNIGSSTADPNIVFTGGNANVASSINMTMYASGTLSWDGTAGQLFSITNSLTGTIFSVNDISGIPSITVNSLGNIVLAQYSGNVTIGAAQGQASNVLSVAGNLYTSGNSYVAQNQFINGNIVAYGSNDLFGGRVGIGTTTTVGANSNVLAVYGTTMQFGNLVIRSQAAGTSGIYFADGSFQSSAAGTPTPAGNNTEIQFNNGGAFGASSSLTWNGSTLNATLLRSSQSIGDEGGQIDLAAPAANTTINSGVAIDVFQNRLRFFESGGTNRGYYLDITSGGTGASTNLIAAIASSYSNANVANYLSNSVQVGNLTINNTTASTSTLTGALLMGGGAGIQGAVHIGGLIYGASTLNIAGAAQVNSLVSNGAVSGTTGTFTSALYASSFNSAGTATVNALVSNGAVSGTTGTFTSALYGASFNTAGTATVASLVSNGAISGTTITGTSATVTSLQNSGTETVNALVANVYGVFGQNLTVRSSNTSTSTTTGALVVTGGVGLGGALHVSGQIYSASTLNIASTAQVNSLISNGAITGTALTVTSLQSSGTATVNSLVSNGAISGTTITGTAATVTSLQSSGTATVNALVSNGAISGTTITGTSATVTSLQSSGTATVNALVSNTDVRTATVNASSTIVGANIYSNGFVQAAGTVTGQAVSSNTTVTAGTGLTVTSGGMTVTGTSSFTGNVNITGNVNVTGAVNSTSSNVLVVQDPLIFVGANNPGDTYDLGIVGSYTEGTYFHTGIVRNAGDNFWTVFDTLTGAPNVITGNINWNDSTLTYGPFKAGNIVVVGNTASVGTTTGAMIINGTGGLGVGGRLNVGGSAWFAGTVNAGGTAIVNSLSSNGAVSGTTGTFTSALYAGSFNTAGTATVNALVSNGAISGTTVTGTAGTFTSIQNSGQSLVNSLVANVFARFGQNVEIDSSNASTSSSAGALQVAGGVGITGNLNVGGANNLFTNRVGIGTSDVLGARSNVLAVYGSENLFGNLVIANTAAGGSGIYFPDGSYQQTASAVGGVNQSVQFNDNGLFGGQTNFIYDKTNIRLGIGTTNLTNSLMVFSATPAWFNTTNGADQQIIIGNSTATGTVIGFNSSGGSGLNTNGYISAIGAASRNISITRTGTGIGGVTLPQNTLEIGGTTIIGGTYSGNTNFINPPANGLSVQGSVGVGTFTPISTLDVRGGGAFTGAVNIGGTATVNALTSNGAVSGTSGTFTAALYGGSFNTAGTATVASLVSNGAVSGTTGTFTGALYGASFNTAGTATVNALVSNGAVSGTTGTFTGALYGGSFNSAGTATVNALVSNGAISGTTITGTAATVTSLQNSGTETVNALISNVYGRFGQNVTVNSANTSTSTTTGALVVGGGVGIAGAIHAGGLIYGASTLNIAGAAQVNSLISNGAVSGTTGTFTSALYGGSFNSAGTATVASLVSNGAVSGTTGTFTGALYGGSFNTAGTATVSSLVSNGAISGTTITGTVATVTSLQNSGTATVNALVSNVYGLFGQNVTVNSTNASTSTTTGALIVAGGAGISGNVNVGGANNLFTNRVGIGTSTVLGARANVLSVYGNADVYGNLDLANPAGGTSGIYFSDGSYQITAAGSSTPYGNTNVASYLSGPIQIGNLTIVNTTASTSTLTGALRMGGGAGIQGAVHIGGLIYGASTLNIAGAAQVNSLISNGAVSGTTGTFTSALYGASFNTAGTATVSSLVSNGAVSGTTGTFTGALYGASFNTAGTATVNALVSNGAVSGTTGTFTGALYGSSFNTAGTATVNALLSNGAISGTTITGTAATVTSIQNSGQTLTNSLVTNVFARFGQNVEIDSTNASTSTTTGAFLVAGGVGIVGAVHIGGLIYGASTLNIASTAQVNSLISNGAVSGTTGTFTSALYGGSFNSAGTATVNALVSNGAVSGTTGTFTGALYSASFNTAGTATVNALVSNGAISGTTITSTAITATSIQNSGLERSANIVSNTWIHATQNLTVASSNTSTSTTTGAFVLSGGAGIAGATHVGGLIYGASTLNIAGAAQVNSLISNGAVSGTTGTFTSALYGASFNTAGTATVNALVSNGAVSGTTGTFTGALYGGSFNTAGTATVNALVSNGAISGTTITGTSGTFTSIQNSGQTLTNSLVANVFARFGQNVEIDSSNTSTSSSNGALQVAGGVGISGNVNTGGTRNIFGGAVGVGTSTADGMIAGAGVSNDVYVWGNVRIANTAATSSGIVFADGTRQTTAATGSGSGTSFGAAGTIQFAGAANAFTGDTANLFWDDTNNRLGLLTTNAPASTLDVRGGVGVTGASNFGATVTVSSLVSNGAISGTTINGTTTTVTSLQSSGTATVNTLISNVYGLFGQNVTVNSTNASTSSTTGALLLVGGAGIGGNINVGGANNLFTNRVGIGTSAVLGARANVLAVYGTAEVYGNIDLGNPAGGTSGIYFSDGTYQTSAAGQGIVRQTFTATAGQTTFTVSYVPGAIDVYQNGSKLNVGTDVTATNGTSIVLAIAADAGDTIETLTNSLFNVANAIPLTGGTVSGQLTLTAGGGALGLGFTPTGWSTASSAAIEIQSPDSAGSTTSVASIGIDGETAIVRNSYYDGTDWVYRAGGASAIYYQDSGANHVWGSTGTSGIAGNPFTYDIVMTLSPSGNLVLLAVTPSTDTTTGVIAVGGGIGIGGNVNVGGQLNNFSGNLAVLGSNTSTSSTTGALIVTNGVGIGGNINVGGTRHTFNANVGIGTTTPRDTLQVFGGNISVGIDTANVTMISPNYITFTVQGNVPTEPATGDMQIFAKNNGTRAMLAQHGTSGIDTTLQPLIGKNRCYYWAPPGLNTATVPATLPGTTAFTTVGTATARAFATTNIRTRMTRLGYVSVATAGSLASLRVATAWLTTGTGATQLGGFFYICRFGVSDAAAVAGARMFVGVSANTAAATNVEPSTLVNSFGVAQLSTDNTQWYFVYGGSVAQTAIALGTALGAPTLTTTSWDLSLFAPPNQNGVIGYTLTNLDTEVSVTGSITPGTPGTQTPANTTALTPQIWRTNNATALAVGIDFISLYVETDD